VTALQNGGGQPSAKPQHRYAAGALLNAMTVDVEDYFQVQALADKIPRASWDQIPRRVESNIDRLLHLFSDNGVSATFFALGWIAERHPEMMRRIATAGHELASHGYDHTRVDRLGPASFRDDVRRTKGIIEEITGYPVLGYRAPTFSIGPDTPWAYEMLEQEGYSYSSSIYPIRNDLYGDLDGPRRPFQPGTGTLWEFPLTTRRLFGQNFPCAGGGYFRLLPYWTSQRNIRHVNVADKLPCIFYFHPWEIDPAQPRVRDVSMRTRLRHYIKLDAMATRLARLVRDFHWSRMEEVFADRINGSAAGGRLLRGEEN
jgi:polysaccharide deacetylase family protein (PEP-CTERM system associated)